MNSGIRSLRAFLTLCKKLNFKETSALHHMQCSTLSRMISRLEYDMNATFFKRSKRKVELTTQGKIFQAYARKAIAQYEHVQNELNSENPVQLAGDIIIASAPTLASTLLPKITRLFMQRYPDINVHTVIKVRAISFSNDPNHKKYDFLCQSAGGIATEDTVHHYIAQTKMVLACKKGNKALTSLQQLNDVYFIRSDYPDFKQLTESVFYKHNIQPKKVKYINSHEIICDTLISSQAYAFLPENVINHHPQKNELHICALEEELPAVNIGFRMKVCDHDSPVHQAFWNFLLELENPFPF